MSAGRAVWTAAVLAAALLGAASAPGAGVEETRGERMRAWIAVLKAEPDNAEAMARLGEILMGARMKAAETVLQRAAASGGEEGRILWAEWRARNGYGGREGVEAALREAEGAEGAGARLAESAAKLKLGDVDGALEAAVAAGEALGEDAGEELQWRVAEQLEECAKWAKVFSLVE